MFWNTFIFYSFFSSVVFIYGIGFDVFLSINKNTPRLGLHCLRFLFIDIISVSIIWPLTTYILIPARLFDIYPFFAVFVILFVSTVAIFIFRRIVDFGIPDFILSFLVILLSINESFSFLSSISIVVVAGVLFYLIIFCLRIYRNRLLLSHPLVSFNSGSLLLLTIAFILLVVYSNNISWLNS